MKQLLFIITLLFSFNGYAINYLTIYYPVFSYNNLDMHEGGVHTKMISIKGENREGEIINLAYNSRGQCEDYLVSEKGINTFPKIKLNVRLNYNNQKEVYFKSDYELAIGYCAKMTLGLGQ